MMVQCGTHWYRESVIHRLLFFVSRRTTCPPGVASSGLRDPPPAVNSQIDNGKRNFQKVIKKLKKGVDKSKFLVYNVLVRLIKQLTQGGRNNDR